MRNHIEDTDADDWEAYVGIIDVASKDAEKRNF